MHLKDQLVALAIPAICTAAAVPLSVRGGEIVGGGPAAEGDFPFIVSLQQDGSHFCGGSLLNANTVLTAGHCAVNQDPSTIMVRAGSLDRTQGGTFVGVSSIVVNPNYNASITDFDVAIFKLATPIPASSTIGYATLPAAGFDPAAGEVMTVAGWGTLTEGAQDLPTLLQEVTLPVVSRTDCQADYSAATVTNNMFCAGIPAGGEDSCQGDSGGPIVDASTRVLIGTVSWGDGCAEAGKPGVYADVGAMLPFITSNL